jgi:hypothetical protein
MDSRTRVAVTVSLLVLLLSACAPQKDRNPQAAGAPVAQASSVSAASTASTP